MNDLNVSKTRFLLAIFVSGVLLLISGALLVNDELQSHRLQDTAGVVSAYIEKLDESSKKPVQVITITNSTNSGVNVKVENNVKTNTNTGTTQPNNVVWPSPSYTNTTTTTTTTKTDSLEEFKNSSQYLENEKKIKEIQDKVDQGFKEFCEKYPDSINCN